MNQVAQNEKPQAKSESLTQGKIQKFGSSNKNTKELEQKKARYEKGLELYREGKVSITPNGMYRVNGYLVDLRTPVECECPDFTNRHEACKHIFCAKIFDKNRRSNDNGAKPENSPFHIPETHQEGNREAFDSLRVSTRLSAISSAVEMLKTHPKPIEPEEVFFLASRLEKWALGG